MHVAGDSMEIHGIPIFGKAPLELTDKLRRILIPADVDGLKRIYFVRGDFGGHNGCYLQAINKDDWFDINSVDELIAADKMPCIVVNTDQDELLTVLVFLHEVGHHCHRMASLDEDASEVVACMYAIAKAAIAYKINIVPDNEHWRKAAEMMSLI